MIQYEKDGVTLSGSFPDGQKFSHSPMDGAPYNDMVAIRDAQLQAIRENTQAAANYATALANAQISLDAGHAVTPPAKPLMKVVGDVEGKVSYVPFDPPLADLRAATAATPAPSAPNVGTQAAARDHQIDVMAAQVNLIFRKLYPEA